MSDPTDDRTPLDDVVLDRLVDGELTDRQRLAVLEQLEREPDGWKRCALAYLEAQCWRESAGQLDALEPMPACAPEVLEPGPIVRSSPRWVFRKTLAMAAVILLAFLLGMVAAHSRGGRDAQNAMIAQRPAPVLPAPVDPGVPSSAPQRPASLPQMAVVHVAGQEPATYQVPVVSAASVDWRWLERPPSPVPENVVRQWQRQGYEVAQRRRVVSTELPSGELVAVPIDEVELRYVGQRLY
jgi:hypothetical protein